MPSCIREKEEETFNITSKLKRFAGEIGGSLKAINVSISQVVGGRLYRLIRIRVFYRRRRKLIVEFRYISSLTILRRKCSGEINFTINITFEHYFFINIFVCCNILYYFIMCVIRNISLIFITLKQ